MESSRKRTALACNFCRRRKRRCDGKFPSCGLCNEAGEDCVYNESVHGRTRVETNSLDFTRRLEAIEEFIYGSSHGQSFNNIPAASIQQAAQPSHLSPPTLTEPELAPAQDEGLEPAPDTTYTGSTVCSKSHATGFSPLEFSNWDIPPMNIPLGHTTTTATLLQMSKVRALLGEFPVDLFISTEANRAVPADLSFIPGNLSDDNLPILDELDTAPLVRSFFDSVHPEIPILDEGPFLEMYHALARNGLRDDCNSALCMLVIALGAAVTADFDEVVSETGNVPGAKYISPALRIMTRESFASFNVTLALPQALILASKYFGYLLRPLQSWRMVHMASTSIQYIYERLRGTPQFGKAYNSVLLVAWAAFDTECDLIAEHHLPRSGIEFMVETMPLPSFDDRNLQGAHYWLAELSARRLLNRVHYTMYRNEKDTVPTSEASLWQILNICDELDRQLEDWFHLLPPIIQPTLGNPSERSAVELNLLHRFHSTKDVILRPLLICTCQIPDETQIPPVLISRSENCLNNCRAYLEVSMQRLSAPSSCGEIMLHSAFAAVMVLTLGSLCPSLAHLVTDIEALQTKAITTMEPFAIDGSSMRDLHEITILLRDKTRVLRRGSISTAS